MAVTAREVKALRDRTGAGPLDCKKALEQFQGDLDKAADFPVFKHDVAAATGLQADERPPQCGLSGAGFTDQSHCAPPCYAQSNVVHCLDVAGSTREQALFDRKPDTQVCCVEQAVSGRRRLSGGGAGRFGRCIRLVQPRRGL